MLLPDTHAPSVASVVATLTAARIAEVAREFGVAVPKSLTKAQQAARLAGGVRAGMFEVLHHLTRDELRAACRQHGLDDAGRARVDLVERLLAAADLDADAARRQGDDVEPEPGARPQAGDIVVCRQRQYRVVAVTPGPRPGDMTGVEMVCLDDDAQGRPLHVLWELELGARIVRPHRDGLGDVTRTDDPRAFVSWLYALRWNAVTATDGELYQAPFRAGIQLLNHQLTPLDKALRLPRANLFVADDVGLGKTIEAGLVLQELMLRQRVDFVLIVCPAAIVLQWRDELERRFGQRFEIWSRSFVARRRRERGFAVNPWTTHQRFIISYPMLRRAEHRDPLLQMLGDRRSRSLLILDEAHHAAPSSASRYAVDSQVTHTVRDVAPRFENRLFLSATPHNGHSNSFSALLEIMDPQRFTRGVPIDDPKLLEPVMVRRLKADLRALGSEFPRRRIVEYRLEHADGRWTCTPVVDGAAQAPRDLGPGDADELALAATLQEYSALMRPAMGRGRLTFVSLQKRLLSSVEAFARTLRAHARGVRRRVDAGETLLAEPDATLMLDLADDVESAGRSDDARDREDEAAVDRDSAELSADDRALRLLGELEQGAERLRYRRDAKVGAILDWIREHQCPAAGLQPDTDADRAWTGRRLIIFTEYGDTLRYLRTSLAGAFAHTGRGDERIALYYGQMPDEARDEVQRAFNAPPDQHPVRVLIATDAAREGVNLQSACADLVHFDIPWNPARLEQRNGRIDRTLQPAPEVFCRYFVYPQRAEDRVLATLVSKVEVIQAELGSLGAVLMDRIEGALADGIDADTLDRIDREEQSALARRAVTERELETQRAQKALRREVDRAGHILDRSRKTLGHDTGLLRRVVDTGLRLVLDRPFDGQPALQPRGDAWHLPDMPAGWEPTLDTVRPRRDPDVPLWEHRRQPPLPVVFEPHDTMRSDRVQLHLSHPFVQRVLARFTAQGQAQYDLQRVAVLRMPGLSVPHALAWGRLSLFGRDAARLHEQLVSVAAPWLESGDGEHLQPIDEAAEQALIARVDAVVRERFDHLAVPDAVNERLARHAAADFATLWPHVYAEADALGHDAAQKLRTRGSDEALALIELLERQRDRIRREIAQVTLDFGDSAADREQRRQFEHDRRHMEARHEAIEDELATEPGELRALYEVQLTRIEPLGLLYLWPETR